MAEIPGGGGSNLFKDLPRWAWYVGGGVVVIGGFLFYRARKQAQAAQQSSSTSGYTSGAQAGAYGSPLPGAGALMPIFLNPGGSSQGSSATSNVGQPTWFNYPAQNGVPGSGQLQEFQNIGGQLVHRWTDVTGKFQSEVLGSGLTPNSQIQVQQGAFGSPLRIDVFAPTTSGQELHAFYWPGIQGTGPSGWSSELLQAGGAGGQGTPLPAVVGAGTPGTT